MLVGNSSLSTKKFGRVYFTFECFSSAYILCEYSLSYYLCPLNIRLLHLLLHFNKYSNAISPKHSDTNHTYALSHKHTHIHYDTNTNTHKLLTQILKRIHFTHIHTHTHGAHGAHAHLHTHTYMQGLTHTQTHRHAYTL